MEVRSDRPGLPSDPASANRHPAKQRPVALPPKIKDLGHSRRLPLQNHNRVTPLSHPVQIKGHQDNMILIFQSDLIH